MLLAAAVGAGRLRPRPAVLVLTALVVLSGSAVAAEIDATGYQLSQTEIELGEWSRALPPGASVRLDIPPPQQLWGAYFLAGRPLCSQLPLLDTDYPHVAVARQADFILALTGARAPTDAVGHPLRLNQSYTLYRERSVAGGAGACTLRQYNRLYPGPGRSPH
jgi:hypothetical protein